MAKATISGLTVAIGANTKGFTDAIKEIDRVSKNIANDLKTVSQSLKMDPGAIQGYSDKFKLLQEAVDNSAKKVEIAKKAIDALNQDFAEKKVSPEDYAKSLEALKRQLESAEYEYEKNVSALREYDKSLKISTTNVNEGEKAVDKSNKTYQSYYEQTSKASDGTKQLSENLDKSNKSYLLFYEQTSKAADGEKKLTENTEQANKSYKVFYEQTSKASDGTRQLTDNLDKSNKSYMVFYEKTSKAADGEKELTEAVKGFGNAAENAQTDTEKLAATIEGSLTGAVIINGLRSIARLAEDIARRFVEAAETFAKFSGETIKLAGSYEDALGYTTTIYGEKVGAQVKTWVDENTNALRIYKGDLLENVNTFGQLFQTMGLGAEESFGMASNIVSLAADLRAATGKETNDVLESLAAGFTNTTRALRQFGVRIGEADIKAYALDKGIIQVTVDQTKLRDATLKVHEAVKKQEDAYDEYGDSSLEYERAVVNVQKAEENLEKVLGGKVPTLTAAERSTAIYMAMLEQLEPVIGQNERESGLLNSQLNETKTRFENLKLEIGEELLPVAEELLKKFNDFLSTEEGQQIFEDIIQSFADLGKSISEFVESEEFTKFVEDLIAEIPDLIDAIGLFVDWLMENAPKVTKFADTLLEIIDGVEKIAIAQAWKKAEDRITAVANTFGIQKDVMVKAIEKWAEENDLKLTDVYNNWNKYEPQFINYMGEIAGGTEDMNTRMITALQSSEDELINFSDPNSYTNLSGWESFWNSAVSVIETVMDKAKLSILDVINLVTNPTGFFANQTIVKGASNFIGGLFNGRAGGGYGYANMPYLVGDDAQNRPEIFVPNVDGRFLNGDQTERILNNISNNNSRNIGDVNIYVQSYGMNVAEVADELGAAFQNKIRMSGAMI